MSLILDALKRSEQAESPIAYAPTDAHQDVRSKIVLALEAVGVPVEVHHHEVATAGQTEIDLRYGPLTRMADSIMIYKYIAKNIARQNGLTATFMPKPLFQDNGSGMHVHQSLWSGGTNVFFDATSHWRGFCELDDCALTVETTVISTAIPGRMVLDAGGKTLAMDRLDWGYGIILDAPDAKIEALFEEHAIVDVSACEETFRAGDRVRVVPVHVCNCVNMHDRVQIIDGNEVIDCWRVAGRGMVV